MARRGRKAKLTEEKYLEAYEQKPFPTDLKYFLIAVGNIVLNRARSA